VPSKLLEGIDLSKINQAVVIRVCEITGATPEEVTEGWCMDEWGGESAMWEMMEHSQTLFNSINDAPSVGEVLRIRVEFHKTWSPERLAGYYSAFLLDRFILRKLYALMERTGQVISAA
jgi:hypothetical protein